MNVPLFFLNHESILNLADLAKDSYLPPSERSPRYIYATDEDTDAQAYFSVENLRICGVLTECIVLAFRGTESAKDVMIDVSATRVPLNGKDTSFLESFLPGRGEPLVHWGFYHQYRSILPEIKAFLRENAGITDVVCTGHSLGGALATIAAVDLKNRKVGNDKEFSCITFGSPRVGNKMFAERFCDSTQGRSLRFVNNDDPIPLLPSSWRFHHVYGVVEIETDSGPGYTHTYLPGFKQRWERVGRVMWNTVKSTAICGEGSAADHSSEKYYEELREILG